MFKFTSTTNSGASLLEVIVGTAIVGVAIFALVVSVGRSLVVARGNLQLAQATFLLEEGTEALRVMRDRSWASLANLSKGTSYYLVYDGITWRATTTPIKIDNFFTRTFVLGSVNRDGNDRIAIAGTLDAKTLSASSTVSWPGALGGTSTVSTLIYITNLFNE